MRTLFLVLISFVFIATPHAATSAPTQAKAKTAPARLLFLVFDQMRPDYIDRFNLKNFKRLRAMGTNYKEAIVGHLPAITVVSHPVMTTGLAPKDLPWMDHWVNDAKGVVGKPGETYYTTDMSQEQILKALSTLSSEKFLVKRLKDKLKGKMIAIGEKDYATLAFGGPFADHIIYMKKSEGVCRPTGVSVPAYIADNSRFELDCKNKYGTENSFYAVDGNRYFPGTDKDHLGGDVWVADAALEVMRRESDWSGLFLTFAGIDKFGHLLGETDGPTPHSFETPAHLEDIARVADAQLGRLLDELAQRKLLDSTMIISTADHGGQTNEIYLGSGGNSADKPFWINRIKKLSKVQMTAEDTSVRVWLAERNSETVKQALAAMREISKVVRIFELDRAQKPPKFKEVYSALNRQPVNFQKWAKAHDEQLLATIAADAGPDLVATMADEAGFGKIGDHGGTQERVQRIPLMVAGPGIAKATSSSPMRLMDIATLVTKAFGLSESH